MQNNRKELILGSVLLITLVVVGFFLLRWLTGAVFSLEDKTGATIIGGFIAFALAIFAFWREIRKSRQEAHRERKVEIYQNFSEIIFEMIKNSGDDKKNKEYAESSEFMEKMWKYKQGILFYGSPKVINTFATWQKNTEIKDKSALEVMMGVGDLLLAMRSDLGLSNRGLTNLTIHQIYVTDDLSLMT